MSNPLGASVFDDAHKIVRTITDPIVDAAGWDVTFSGMWRWGMVLSFVVYFTRTGSNIPVGSDGDIANTEVCTLPTTARGTITSSQALTAVATGPNTSGGYVSSTGVVSIFAVDSSATVNTNDTFSLGGTMLL